MIRKLLNLIFPDIETLSKKDSDISTKRYADLRAVNHFVAQSWVILTFLIYSGHWEELRIHTVILGVFAFARGILASSDFLTKLTKKND